MTRVLTRDGLVHDMEWRRPDRFGVTHCQRFVHSLAYEEHVVSESLRVIREEPVLTCLWCVAKAPY